MTDCSHSNAQHIVVRITEEELWGVRGLKDWHTLGRLMDMNRYVRNKLKTSGIPLLPSKTVCGSDALQVEKGVLLRKARPDDRVIEFVWTDYNTTAKKGNEQ